MTSVLPKFLEPVRRQFGVAHRVLDIPMSEICLQGARIVPRVCQGEAAGVPQHVRMDFELENGRRRCALDHPGKSGGCERRASLADEHKLTGFTFALQSAKRA